jgi:hypothetical protein
MKVFSKFVGLIACVFVSVCLSLLGQHVLAADANAGTGTETQSKLLEATVHRDIEGTLGPLNVSCIRDCTMANAAL